MSILINLLIIGSSAAIGAMAGWWLGHGRRTTAEHDAKRIAAELSTAHQQLARAKDELTRVAGALEQLQQENRAARSQASEDRVHLEIVRRDAERTKDVIAQLQLLAQHMVDDVGEHSTRVQAINSELGESGKEATDVLLAVTKLLDANADLQSQLETAETKLEVQAAQLQEQMTEARTDALTGLANRRAFDEQMQLVEQSFRLEGRPASVMMLDVDNFKHFNDQHGHDAGDEVLRAVAHVLQRSVGSSALVCRYGGEEFAVIFAGLPLASAIEVAESARRALGNTQIPWGDETFRITACAGIAEFRPGDSALSVIKRADEALYHGKSSGRDRGYWHDGRKAHLIHENNPSPATKATFNRDPLMGLSSQQSFTAELDRRIAERRRGGLPVSVLLIELDDFDELTAQHGALAGATMLRATAQLLRTALRDIDQVARFGAREFGLLLPGTSADDAEGVAERLRVAIEKCKLPADGGLLTFTLSIALTEAAAEDTAAQLLPRLRETLRTAAQQGGNQTMSLVRSAS